MVAGGLGAPSLPAAKPVEKAPGHGQESVTILYRRTEEPIVQEMLPTLKYATRHVTTASS